MLSYIRMPENAQNTNQNPVDGSGGDLLDNLSAMAPDARSSSALLANSDGAAAQAKSADGPVDPKAKQSSAPLDLSGLEATVDSFATTKSQESARIDFNVAKGSNKKDKAMEEAMFERTFFNKLTKAIMFFLVFAVLLAFGYIFQQYMRFMQGQPVGNTISYYMPSIHKTYLSISKLMGRTPNKYGVESLTTKMAQQNLNTMITDASLDYIVKKEVLTKTVSQLISSTTTQYTRLDEIKQDIGSYGFFPKDVQVFAASTFVDNSLQKSLVAVEAIRFSTAMTFFSNLDTFLQQFSSFVSLSPEQVAALIDVYKSRGEKDIQNYLTTCYFNPYVNADNCAMPQGNDFANYYTYVDTKASIEKRIFPILMSYLDAKLENSDFPSLEIDIKNFDPLQNNISFEINLNTFQEDELQLLNKGILNPHIYLATKIINLLRESKFIV
ncbi:hypothetical protein KBC03_00975, partial [Patescibacteria group bacterium]|nr:hypothetical protein [Patescibacteria group bacterium]